MIRIEQAAQKFIEAAGEITELTRAIAYSSYSNGPEFQLSKDGFNKVTAGLLVASESMSGSGFWVKSWVNVGGIKFFHVEQDEDKWAKALGYVKAEEAKTA